MAKNTSKTTSKKTASKVSKTSPTKAARPAAKSTVKSAAKPEAKSAVKAKGGKATGATKSAKSASKASGGSSKKAMKEYRLKVGDVAPSFAAQATSGKNLSLKEFSGKKLVLYFYPKDNTPGCTLEGQDFKRLASEFKKANAEIVGVSQDSVRSHEKFKSKCGFPFELLSDHDGSICKAFDVIQMKNMYGRDFEGIERSTFVVDEEGRIGAEWRKVRVEGHAKEVLDAIKAM